MLEDSVTDKYRIKEIDHCGRKSFCLQKKSFLGFWYNPDNFDGAKSGWYDSLEEANQAFKLKTTPAITRIIKPFNP